MTGVSRRGLFGALGVGAAGVGVGVASGYAVGNSESDAASSDGSSPEYEFYGQHQAGITTPAQDRMHFAAFDVTTRDRSELIELLKEWTQAAAAMTVGRSVGGPMPYQAPPADTGEAIGLPASGLTLTFGFGPSLFVDDAGDDRFGLADQQPAVLNRLPHFPADALQAHRSDGDLCIQACANDPQVAVHAIRNLSRIAFGRASLRWSQLGFGRTSSTSTAQTTPRNLFGFKDGTANIKSENTEAVTEHVWVDDSDDAQASWMVDGSYLVARRISMSIETWDRTSLQEQESIFARDRSEGAPLSGGTEFSEPDFEAKGGAGELLIDTNSHVRLAHPRQNGGAQMLRRGYNFTDGSTDLGRLDAGLFFVAFVRDPETQYIPMQTRMSGQDTLMEYIQHTGSALFAVPPGAPADGWVGQTLFS